MLKRSQTPRASVAEMLSVGFLRGWRNSSARAMWLLMGDSSKQRFGKSSLTKVHCGSKYLIMIKIDGYLVLVMVGQ